MNQGGKEQMKEEGIKEKKRRKKMDKREIDMKGGREACSGRERKGRREDKEGGKE